MEIRVNLDRMQRLSEVFRREKEELESIIRDLEKQIFQVLANVYNDYSELDVRRAVHEAEKIMQEIIAQKNKVCESLEGNERQIKSAMVLYLNSEAEALTALGINNLESVGTLKSQMFSVKSQETDGSQLKLDQMISAALKLQGPFGGMCMALNATKSILDQRTQLLDNLEGCVSEKFGREEGLFVKSLAGAMLGADTIFGGYIGTGIPGLLEKTYETLEASMPTVTRLNASGKQVMCGRASKVAIAECADLATKTNVLRGMAKPFENNVGKAVGVMAKSECALKALGTKLGIAGAVAEGGYNVYSDLNNEEYTDRQKATAVEIHAGAMGASVAAVVLVCVFLPGPGWAVAASIVVGVAASTIINYETEKAIHKYVEGKSE